MQVTRNRTAGKWGGLAAAALWAVLGATLAEGGDLYVGVTGALDGLEVMYDKTVDNTDPSNLSLNPGSVIEGNDSASKPGYGYGFLAGYRMPISLTGVFVSAEGDLTHHRGSVEGRFEGVGTSEGRNQLGENWPEDWSFSRDWSYGLTVRVGAGIPIVGPGFGPSIYGLVGVRRLSAGFRTDYSGCLSPTPCTEASQFVSGTDSFKENFTGWTTGGGLEKKLAMIALRGELRYTRYGSAGRVIPFDDVGVTVPVSLEASGIGIRVGLLLYF